MPVTRAVLPAFLGAETCALLGNSALLVVFPWLVLERTGSTAETAAIATLTTLPIVLASLLSGRLIDRIGRRRASLLATAGCTLSAAGFGLFDRMSSLSLIVIAVLGLMAETFTAPATTARDALMADVAAAAALSLDRVAGSRQVVFSLAFLAGPAFAGTVLSVAGPIPALWGIAALWSCSLLLTATLPDHHRPVARTPMRTEGLAEHIPGDIPRAAPDSAESASATGSIRTLFTTQRALRVAVIIGFGSSVITGPMTSVILPSHFQHLGEPGSYGAAMSAFAVGSIFGALAYTVIPARAHAAWFAGAVVVTTLGMAGFAVLPATGLLALALALVGAGSAIMAPMLLVAVTRHSSEHERGRALGLYNAAALGASPIGLGLLSLLLLAANLTLAALAVLGMWLLVAALALVNARTLTTTLGPQQTATRSPC